MSRLQICLLLKRLLLLTYCSIIIFSCLSSIIFFLGGGSGEAGMNEIIRAAHQAREKHRMQK